MARRKTKQRMAILDVLKEVRIHPSADWIYDEVRKKFPHVSKGTIYRNLNVLEDEGVIMKLNVDGVVGRYEIRQSNHYHFICDKCGRVFDLDGPIETKLNMKFSKKTGFKIIYHQLEFRGLCHDCQVKQAKAVKKQER